MNQDQAQGLWNQFTGGAKRLWGKLTRNDDKMIEGVLEAHHGAIQEKAGDNTQTRKAQTDRIAQFPQSTRAGTGDTTAANKVTGQAAS